MIVSQNCQERGMAMNEVFSEQDEQAARSPLQRRHWLAIVAVFAVVELAVVIAMVH